MDFPATFLSIDRRGVTFEQSSGDLLADIQFMVYCFPFVMHGALLHGAKAHQHKTLARARVSRGRGWVGGVGPPVERGVGQMVNRHTNGAMYLWGISRETQKCQEGTVYHLMDGFDITLPRVSALFTSNAICHIHSLSLTSSLYASFFLSGYSNALRICISWRFFFNCI